MGWVMGCGSRYDPPSMAERRVIHANVSETAFLAWQDFGHQHGVSVTGLIEAMGTTGPLAGAKSLNVDALIREARRVDSERRRRRQEPDDG